MLSPLPRRSGWAYSSLCFTQPYQTSSKGLSGRPAHCPFRRLLSVHSRSACTLGCRQFVTRAAAEIHRWGAGEPETNRKRAEETVALAPAIIVAFGSSAVAALVQATRSVQVVFAEAVDPGLAPAMLRARSGRVATLPAFCCLNTVLAGKWLELDPSGCPPTTPTL
jgi:hypothetical protein